MHFMFCRILFNDKIMLMGSVFQENIYPIIFKKNNINLLKIIFYKILKKYKTDFFNISISFLCKLLGNKGLYNYEISENYLFYLSIPNLFIRHMPEIFNVDRIIDIHNNFFYKCLALKTCQSLLVRMIDYVISNNE